MNTTRLLIDGKWVEAHSERTFPSVNPADGSVLKQVAEADATDVNRAVGAARAAFDTGHWTRFAPSDRAKCIYRLADLVEQHQDELARLETIDSGKPILESRRSDLPKTIDCLRFFAGAADKIYGQAIPVDETHLSLVLREPFGVVAQIIPWNFPILLAVWKLAPALAAGNTVVLKPAEETSLSILRLGELVIDAGFPPGVVNIITGSGELTGRCLVNHPDVNKIAFTGSTAIGQEIARTAAGMLKSVSLELGGKGPNMVFPDADIGAAVDGALKAAFSNQGQVCCSGSRLFLHKSIYEKFLDRLEAKVRQIRQGEPLDPRTTMGPQVSQVHYQRILDYIEIGKKEGAMALCGGGKSVDPGLARGFYIQPTLFVDVKNSMRIAREEIFGPVLSVIPFEDEGNLVAQANDTIYGLSAGIWTRDIARAHRLARQIQAGTIWVNCFNKTNPAVPFGGYKMSGYGRDNGMEAALQYTQTKSVWISLVSGIADGAAGMHHPQSCNNETP